MRREKRKEIREKSAAGCHRARPGSFLVSLFSFHSAPRGFIGLLTVIVLGALILSIGITTAFVGQTQLILAAHADHEYAVRALVTACVEESVHRLKLNSGYAGGTVPLGADACTVTVSGSGSSRTIAATATVDGYTKAVAATATLKQNAAANARAWSVTAWAEADPP
jgi:hypothetical protein